MYVSIQDALDSSSTVNDGGLLGLWFTSDAWSATPTWTSIDTSAIPPAGSYCWNQCYYDEVLSVDPANASILYAGGVYLWKYNGSTWTDVTTSIHVDQHAMAWAGTRLIVGNDGGVFSTTNGGTSWSSHNTNLSITQFHAGSLHPTDGNIALGGAQDNGINQWAGATGWPHLLDGDGGYSAFSSGAPNTNWLVTTENLEIYRTTNGANFSHADAGITKLGAIFIAPIAKCPSLDDVMLAAGGTLWRTTNFFSSAPFKPSWLPGLALAGGGTLENSQCSIELNNSSATALGQTLTLNLSMTFKIAYAGSKNIYLSAVNIDGVTTDWQQRGTWTVGVTLGAVSITPNSGTGVSRTFSAVFTDSLGVTTDLRVARVRFGVSTAGACVVDYNAMTNMVRILDDAGTPGAFGPFSGTLANSQCTVDLVQSSATPSGTTLALSLKITFKAALIGPQPIFLRANGNFGAATTGWIARGTWDVNAAVQAISVTPNNGSGSTQTFTLAYSDAEGVVADLRVARVRFSGGSGPCVIDYNAMTNQVRMQNDLGEWGNFKSFGAGAINNNSQCSLNLVTSSATPIGTNLTLTLALTFKAAFAGAKTIDMRANSNVGSTTGWLQKGTWTNVPIVATVDAVSASPNAGTGAFKMFTLQYTDSLGATDLASARVRFATTNVGPGSCSVWYNANAANISLMDDAGAWGAAVPLGSGTLANSQCTVNVAATTATLNGNMLTLGLSVAFSGNFAGAKNTFMLAASAGGPSTGWLIRGAWSVPDALLRDDFSGSSLDSSTWFMPVGAGTFLGRTQLRPPSESLAVANGVIRLRLDTYNPTALTPGDSFWGSEIVSNTIFPRGAGLSFSTRARLVGPIPGGMVASLFSYMTQSGLHDEIDVELLSNDLASPRVLTNVFNNDNFTVPGHPLFATVPGFSLTDFNLYRVDWLSDRVRWWINGILVREDLVNVPDDPMTIRLNLWAPSSTFAAAYNAALQPVDNAGANQTFFYDVDFVEVRDAQ